MTSMIWRMPQIKASGGGGDRGGGDEEEDGDEEEESGKTGLDVGRDVLCVEGSRGGECQ